VFVSRSVVVREKCCCFFDEIHSQKSSLKREFIHRFHGDDNSLSFHPLTAINADAFHWMRLMVISPSTV
jgi:hypothetical protein